MAIAPGVDVAGGTHLLKGMQARVVIPELLDGLAFDDPAARHNRRDLRRLNALMGNFSWFATALSEVWQPGQRWLELGSGDGSLGRFLGRRFAPGDWHVTGVDFWPRAADWPGAWEWRQTDALAFAEAAEGVSVNLLLHQFSAPELARLGERWNESNGPRMLLLNEPLRRPHCLWLARASFLLGQNHVTRHDALVSVRAGFRRGELARLLGLDAQTWALAETETLLGASRLIAVRKERPST